MEGKKKKNKNKLYKFLFLFFLITKSIFSLIRNCFEKNYKVKKLNKKKPFNHLIGLSVSKKDYKKLYKQNLYKHKGGVL